jgi:parallel beta-helix repeat protein
LRGSRWAVIDATGFEYGIMVGESVDLGPEGCPEPTVSDFRIHGFTIRNADDTGLRLTGVDGYEILGGRYLDNEEYGPFPVCSTRGRIAGNFAAGHKDAAIYVGDDDDVVVEYNVVTRSAIGIEIENSTNAIVRFNGIGNNTTGILVVVLPGLPMPFTDDVLIEGNIVVANNFPNPIPIDEPSPVALLPSGTGILNVGGDRVIIRDNLIADNGSVGLALVGNFFAALDPRIEPFIDGNEVRDNLIVDNGLSPDPERALTPGVDIVFFPDLLDPETGLPGVFDPDPTDNCFSGNQFNTQFPPLVTSFFPCP